MTEQPPSAEGRKAAVSWLTTGGPADQVEDDLARAFDRFSAQRVSAERERLARMWFGAHGEGYIQVMLGEANYAPAEHPAPEEPQRSWICLHAYDICKRIKLGEHCVHCVPSAIAPEGGNLFVAGEFTAHSGGTLPFKIDCDALTDADIATLAAEIARRFKFAAVVGIPRGGIRLFRALAPYADHENSETTLIVDDVLTTGRSMEEARVGRGDVRGVVIFARGPCPDWVTPLFTATPPTSNTGRRSFGEPAPRNFTEERPGPGWKISEETQRELAALDGAVDDMKSLGMVSDSPPPAVVDYTERAREVIVEHWVRKPGVNDLVALVADALSAVASEHQAEIAALHESEAAWIRRAATAVATTSRVQQAHEAKLARLREPDVIEALIACIGSDDDRSATELAVDMRNVITEKLACSE